MTTTTPIGAPRMRALVERGRARPLLEGYFPVPVELDGWWWHVPAQPPPGVGRDAFVPTPAEIADELVRLAARRRAADDAVHGGGVESP
jgi:hypothetical protein